TCHLGAAAGRRQIAGEDAHCGRLARAVWPEEAEHFAFADVEGDVGHRDARSVVPGEVFNANHAAPPPVSSRVLDDIFARNFKVRRGVEGWVSEASNELACKRGVNSGWNHAARFDGRPPTEYR